MQSVKIVADSIGPNGVRITTFCLTYVRFIHSEFMTHRMISKNSASSRAIPCKKMRAFVLQNPAMPVSFSQNKAGMQAAGDISPLRQTVATTLWKLAGYTMCGFHWVLEKLGVHKQHANRILEPWLHMTVVCTATDWDNFFALRCHPMAQPEFQALAREMYEVYSKSCPRELKEGMWHLPYVDEETMNDLKRAFNVKCLRDSQDAVVNAIAISVARCARTSYLNNEGRKTTIKEDWAMNDRLLSSQPLHASPAEHQAQALAAGTENRRSGNLRGWTQYRKMLPNENVTTFVPGMFDERE